MISLHHISKVYNSDAVETRALNEVSLTIQEGDFVSIMGPSGCGKSTLINVIGLLDEFDSGLYLFDDKDVKTLSSKKKVKLRKSNIGFIFQNFNLLEELTVFENIELPLTYQGVKAKERKLRTEAVLHKIGLAHRQGHFPYQLSGGQQQKVAIGRAIVTRPRLILADEPTGNLDSEQGNAIMEYLSSLNEQGTTVVMVTHSMSDATYSNRIIKLRDGAVVSEKQMAHV